MGGDKSVETAAVTINKVHYSLQGWFMARTKTMENIFEQVHGGLIREDCCQGYKWNYNKEFPFIFYTDRSYFEPTLKKR